MRRVIVSALVLLAIVSSVSACHSDPNMKPPSLPADQVLRPASEQTPKPDLRDNQAKLYQGSSQVDPEQREYARLSRERLRAIELRAQQLTAARQAIPPASQGEVAATLNLLPAKCDETEREIDALETINSAKWQQKRHNVDRKLANLERSLDRVQFR